MWLRFRCQVMRTLLFHTACDRWQNTPLTLQQPVWVCGSPSSLAACSHDSSVIRAFPFTLSPTFPSFSACTCHRLSARACISVAICCSLIRHVKHWSTVVCAHNFAFSLCVADQVHHDVAIWFVNDMYHWSELGQSHQHLSFSLALFPPNWSQELRRLHLLAYSRMICL